MITLGKMSGGKPRGSVTVRTTPHVSGGRIGSGVRVSASFQVFALRMLPIPTGEIIEGNLRGGCLQGNGIIDYNDNQN